MIINFLVKEFDFDSPYHICIHFQVHFRHFHTHFRLANSSPSSSPISARNGHCWTSTAGFRSEWARLDLNRKGLNIMGTTGPQPGTFGIQWIPLDLNLEPSVLSKHHWTSIWDPPSSVSTARPQPRTLRTQ